MFNDSNKRFDLETFSYNYNHRHDDAISNYIAIDTENRMNGMNRMNTMKIYLVCDTCYCYYDLKILKGFTSLQKAFEYATDVVMERTDKYNRDYVLKVIENRYDQVDRFPDLFVYTDFHDMDSDRYITIKEIDVD